MGFFKQRQRLVRMAHAEETHAVHLDRLTIVLILGGGAGESLNGLRELLPLVKDHATQALDTGGFRILSGQLVELRHRLVQASAGGQVLCGFNGVGVESGASPAGGVED